MKKFFTRADHRREIYSRLPRDQERFNLSVLKARPGKIRVDFTRDDLLLFVIQSYYDTAQVICCDE